jgi:hypothetical protein
MSKHDKLLATFAASFLGLSAAQAAGPSFPSSSINVVLTTTPATTASAYTANSAVGGLQTVPLFRTTVRPGALLGTIGMESFSGAVYGSVVIYGFLKSPASTCTDKTAFVLSSNDVIAPGFPITISLAANGGSTQTTGFATVNTPEQNLDTTPALNMYFCAVTPGTPTPGSVADVRFTYSALQD